MRHFFRLAIAPKRGAPMRESRLMLIGNGLGNTGVNGARANGIDGNAFFPKLNRQPFCETDNAMLGRRIR